MHFLFFKSNSALTNLFQRKEKKINEQPFLLFFFLKHLWSIYIYSEYLGFKEEHLQFFTTIQPIPAKTIGAR